MILLLMIGIFEMHWLKGMAKEIILCSHKAPCHDKGNDLLTRGYLKVRMYTGQNEVVY